MLSREHLGTRLRKPRSIQLHRDSAAGYNLQRLQLKRSRFGSVFRGLRPVAEPFDDIHMSYNII
ncbi:hypothetical protein D3C81_2283560 [compost metagenome]